MVCLFTAAQPGPDWALMDGESVRDGEREMSGDELVNRLQLKSIKAAMLALSLSVLLPLSHLFLFFEAHTLFLLYNVLFMVKKSNLVGQKESTVGSV